MATWPANGDTDWNTKMLAYLAVEHETDGTHKATELTAVVTGEGIFGAWTNQDTESQTLAVNHSYLAQSDGFVVITSTATDQRPYYTVYTDSSNPPTTNRTRVRNPDGSTVNSVRVPVKKGDYWKITDHGTFGNVTIFWLPFGTGGCVDKN